MKKYCLIALALLCAVATFAIERSQTIVVIDGAKYYIHTVNTGETIYSLSKVYGVNELIIVENNPSISAGLKVADRLKIPFVVDAPDGASERQLRKDFDMHLVVPGETLYAISRRYSIPIPTIIGDNTNLDPIHLRVGERILIRRAQRGTEPAAQVDQQWAQYRDNLNSIAEPGVSYHLVHSGETFYSISHRFEISEEELSVLNNGLQPSDMKAGVIIKVPGVNTLKGDVSQVADNQKITNSVEQPVARRRDFKSLAPSSTLHVALMLPLASGEKPNANYLEFYQGFLMGLDSVKRAGYSVQLDLYNTGRNVNRVQQMIDDGSFSKIDLIVGPVYEETLAPVIRYAEQKNIPVVSPLANLTHTRSNVLFQLSPATETKYNKISDLIDGSKKLTLIYTDDTDKEFEAEILAMLGNSEYAKRQFRYDVSSRGKAGSSNDLTPMLQNDNNNVFIIMSNDEVDVDRILTAIASANTNIIARGYTAPSFVILGNPRWNRYNNIDRTMFFKNKVTFLSTYHAKRDSEVVRVFDSDYIRAFGSLPTLYSYRGYDAALLFCLAMFGDIAHDMEGGQYTPLQTTYLFGQKNADDNHVNRNWIRVSYNRDFTISIE